jgi:leader peptidase (prepilin peptidase) / N-methyltransferase
MPFRVVLELFAFLLGLVFGSFLNVCIARLPKGESVVRPRSRCPGCGHAIRWYDNVPLVSWLVLRGRCRDCGGRIAGWYPAVELGVGVWFWLAVAGVHLPAAASGEAWGTAVLGAIGFAVLGFLLIGLMAMDWQTGLLPDAFTGSGVAIGFLLVFARTIFLGRTEGQVILDTNHQLRLSSPGSFADQGNVFMTGPEAMILGRLAAVCGMALLLLAIRAAYKAVRHRDGMGLGDVKMLAMIAAFLGFWPAILALFAGVVLASGWAAMLLTRGRATATTRLAFGSFLGVGGLVVAMFGSRLIDSYMALFR